MEKKLTEAIEYLAKYNDIKESLPKTFNTFRSLMNITMPYALSDRYYEIEEEIIKNEYRNKEIVDVNDLKEFSDRIYLFKGDIICLKIDAIVNACNCKLLGCFVPMHKCIDNAIHSYSGMKLRRDLIDIMDRQAHDEENGKAKITKAYNLPSKYIFHTVGPIVNTVVTEENIKDLTSCYNSILNLAEQNNITSIAFCSISTGIYSYPIKDASSVAIKTINEYLKQHPNSVIKKIVFCLYSEYDYEIYKRRLEEYN